MTVDATIDDTNLPKHIIIDRFPINDKGEIWYHLGNMYWCPEYSKFYRWLDGTKIRSEEDFPHDYFMFLDKEYEKEFEKMWGSFIIDSEEE